MSILEQMAMAAERYRTAPEDAASSSPATGQSAPPDRLSVLVAENGPIWTPIRVLERILEDAPAVVKVQLRDGGRASGFMVAPDLLLAPNHVLPSAEAARSATTVCRRSSTEDSTYALRPDKGFHTNQELDYSVVAVDVPGWAEAMTWLSLRRGPTALVGESLHLLGYSGDANASLGVRSSVLLDRLDAFVHYTALRSPGSSGGPVLSVDGNVVGMHHSMVPRTNASGDWIAQSGSIWNGSGDDVDFVAGEGVTALAIVQDLEARAPELGAAVQRAVRVRSA